MKAFGPKPASKRQQSHSDRVCTHPTCKNKKGHTTDNCWTRARELSKRADEIEAKQKGKARANMAEEDRSDGEAASFAGNASTPDYTNPHSPLISNAGADWIADTGATSHMTPHRHWFSTYTPFRTPIRLADDKVVYSVGKGSVQFVPVVAGKSQHLLEFHEVLHVPSLRSNLLSVLYLTRQKQYTVTIKSDSMSFM